MKMGEGQMGLLDKVFLTLGQRVMYNKQWLSDIISWSALQGGEWYMRPKTRKNPTSA